jgi:thiamine pyrophosphokinase
MTDVLIVGNGDSPSDSVLDFFVSKSSTIIALDGAAITLEKRQVRPDVIVGDMDGLTSEQLDAFHSQGVEIIMT